MSRSELPSPAQPEHPKIHVRTLENLRMGSGSLLERLERGVQQKLYNYVNEHIIQAPEFAVQETREVIPDVKLINFGQRMTREEVIQWLKENPEYGDYYELANPEHLDAVNSDPRLAQMTKVENENLWIIALGSSTTGANDRWVAQLDALKNNERWLDLIWWGWRWGDMVWFLLVRKNGV